MTMQKADEFCLQYSFSRTTQIKVCEILYFASFGFRHLHSRCAHATCAFWCILSDLIRSKERQSAAHALRLAYALIIFRPIKIIMTINVVVVAVFRLFPANLNKILIKCFVTAFNVWNSTFNSTFLKIFTAFFSRAFQNNFQCTILAYFTYKCGNVS